MSVRMHGRDETGSRMCGCTFWGLRLSWGSWNNLGQSGGGLRTRDVYFLIVLEARRSKQGTGKEDPPSDDLVEDHSASSGFQW